MLMQMPTFSLRLASSSSSFSGMSHIPGATGTGTRVAFPAALPLVDRSPAEATASSTASPAKPSLAISDEDDSESEGEEKEEEEEGEEEEEEGEADASSLTTKETQRRTRRSGTAVVRRREERESLTPIRLIVLSIRATEQRDKGKEGN
jgi:hypothetical protein